MVASKYSFLFFIIYHLAGNLFYMLHKWFFTIVGRMKKLPITIFVPFLALISMNSDSEIFSSKKSRSDLFFKEYVISDQYGYPSSFTICSMFG